jgi:hypothetical protein
LSNNAKENSEENFDAAYIQLIKSANKILDTLASVWKYSVSALLLSLSVVGIVSVSLYFVEPGREVFLTEGVIFIFIAAWVFARNFLMNCNKCCTADIPRWKQTLSSFVKTNDTIDRERDGQSVVESLMQVVVATGDWIKMIKRDVFSLLFWPIIAILVFALTVFQANVFTLRIVGAVFAVYIGALVIGVYYGVNVKFRKWQTRIKKFSNYAETAVDNL